MNVSSTTAGIGSQNTSLNLSNFFNSTGFDNAPLRGGKKKRNDGAVGRSTKKFN
jgi:hypothetical protein